MYSQFMMHGQKNIKCSLATIYFRAPDFLPRNHI